MLTWNSLRDSGLVLHLFVGWPADRCAMRWALVSRLRRRMAVGRPGGLDVVVAGALRGVDDGQGLADRTLGKLSFFPQRGARLLACPR